MPDPDADAKVLYSMWASDLFVPPWEQLPLPSQERWRRIAERFRVHVTGTLKWTEVWSKV